MLLFRFVGSFLLRLETRTLCGLLFQEPPRILAVLHCFENTLFEQVSPKPPSVAKRNVTKPGPHTALYLLKRQPPRVVKRLHFLQPRLHADHVLARQPVTLQIIWRKSLHAIWRIESPREAALSEWRVIRPKRVANLQNRTWVSVGSVAETAIL